MGDAPHDGSHDVVPDEHPGHGRHRIAHDASHDGSHDVVWPAPLGHDGSHDVPHDASGARSAQLPRVPRGRRRAGHRPRSRHGPADPRRRQCAHLPRDSPPTRHDSPDHRACRRAALDRIVESWTLAEDRCPLLGGLRWLCRAWRKTAVRWRARAFDDVRGTQPRTLADHCRRPLRDGPRARRRSTGVHRHGRLLGREAAWTATDIGERT